MFVISCLSACTAASSEINDKINVISTVFPSYDFARQIGGKNINLTMLTKPGADVHSYEPSAADIAAVQRCDLLICIGGQSDQWINSVLASMENDVKVLRMIDCVTGLTEESVEGMEDDGDEEHEAFDEHVWTSPLNAILISKEINNALCLVDPDNAKTYNSNYLKYKDNLHSLYDDFGTSLSHKVRDTFMVADRFPFLYLAKCFDLNYYAAFAGCTATEDPSADTVAFLINKVKEENLPVIFYIEFSSRAVAKTVSEATGVKAILLHSCHNVSRKYFDSGVTYIELMENNLKALTEALC